MASCCTQTTLTISIPLSEWMKSDDKKTKNKAREKHMNHIKEHVCALLNSDGGTLTLSLTVRPNMSAIDTTKHGLRSEDVIRSIEQTFHPVIGTVCVCTHLTVCSETLSKIVLKVQGYIPLCTMNYNMFLPSNTQVLPISSGEVNTVIDLMDIDRIVDVTEFENAPPTDRFVLNSVLDIKESKTVQFKCLKSDNLASRIIKNKFTSYVSAFANNIGGRIYIGIDDKTGRVVGEILTKAEQNDCETKLKKHIDKMLWPEYCTPPVKGKQWDIRFHTVTDSDGRPVETEISEGEVCVIVITIPNCPGGVFVKTPESYHIVKVKVEESEGSDAVENKVEAMRFTEWKNANDQLELFKKPELYQGKGTILQAILESRCPQTLQICLEIDNGREHIIECLKTELESSRSFIHKVCETPLVNLVKLAIDDTELVLMRLDDDDVTPLMKATEARQLDMVKLILSTNSGKKTSSFQKRSTEETALMIACKNGFTKIVEFMMEISDTDINLGQLDQDGRNVFHHAAKHDELLSVMIDICRRTEKYKNYKDYLQLKDNDGYVSLHHAACIGSYKNVKLLLENGVPYNTPSSWGRTALHYAACSNIFTVIALVGFVKTNFKDKDDVIEHYKVYIDAVDSRLQTALHIAAALGKWQTVSFLLENGATIKYDKENETPLHLASYIGCTRSVQFLLQNNPTIVNHENSVGETPAMFAAVNGQTETLLMLLDHNAKLCAQSHDNSVEKRKTCLDWAVLNRQPDTAKEILKYKGNAETWKETMEKSFLGADGLLANMVISMPCVAIEVLNKCEERKTCAGNAAKYDFFALQTKEEVKSCGKTTECVTSMKALETMAKCSRNECINHVVVQRFLEQKWSLRARKWYMSCLFIYTIFLLSLTAYITLVREGRSCASGDPCAICGIICYVFASLSVIKELFQLFHRKLQYFCVVSTYLELVMYISVFIFLPYDTKSNVQRQAGAIAIFLGWINFTWFLKRFQTYGIYIIMAKKIFLTFLKVFVPVSFFIVAFAMTFFVLFDKQDGFENIARSFLTSFAMMVGEVDYRETFLKQTGKNFVLILLFLVLFLILMSILLMNLLTGLAVGDIGVIMRRSLVEKRIQQAMLIVEMDKHLNKYPGLGAKYVDPLTVTQKPNTCAMSCVRKLMNKMFPRLDIEEKENKKNQEYDIARMKEQLNSMQNTLEEIKRSLLETQASTLPRKNREFVQPRRNTIL